MTDRRPSAKETPVAVEAHDDDVQHDDVIIGRAFWWSVAFVALAGAGVGVWKLLSAADAPEERVVEKDPGTIENLANDPGQAPVVRFTDVTRSSGIDFVHENGARGDKLLPETMGGGCAFFDYDNDGDQDLLLVNSDRWPDDPRAEPAATTRLYRNDGTGRFTDVTAEAGLGVRLYGMGCAVGDYDNDGFVDLFIAALGGNRLFRNAAGRFEDVTDSAGVAGGDREWSSSAGFFDMENDGDLDLFVCNYVEWSREIDIALHFTLNGRDRAYGPPTNYTGTQSRLYRNDGDGRFTDVAAEAGVHVVNPDTGVPVGKALAVLFADVDRNGFLDIFVANDTVRNFLFLNGGSGAFEEAGSTAGVAYDSAGSATGAMGVDAAYYRNDDDLAIAIGNFANEMTSFYVAQAGSMLFSDQAIAEGIGSPSRLKLSFGLFFFDADLDGRLDLLQANGHLEDEINQIQPSQHFEQPAQLFWNCGPDRRACFALLDDDAVGDLARPIVGRGASFADIDGDGDLDVLLTQAGRAPLLLRNDQDLDHHWLRVKLVGGHSNRDGIGAIVEVESDALTAVRRMVSPARSYLAQVELPVTFGLGPAATAVEVRVRWPSGGLTTITAVEVDRTITIEERGADDGASG